MRRDKHDRSVVDVKLPEPWSFLHRTDTVPLPGMREIARYCPLIAAILAPLSTLLDIPALTQRWYALDGVLQKDPTVSIVLSAVGLALNILANSLLLYRFTVHSVRNNSLATRVSLLAWISKTVVAAVNLILFGILTRNAPGYSFREGFWSAVVSTIDSGVIVAVLLIHYIYIFRKKEEADIDVRMQGKQFLLSVTVFIAILAIQALAFCKIEGWTYLDSIYFSVQTALTIGFGDLTPTHTSGKVLVFVFSVLTISQLGNEIAVIIDFFGARAAERREKWKELYEGAMHREVNKKNPNAGLMEEMALIHQINARQDLMSKLYDLVWSALSLVVFWVVGAGMFSSIEGWTYGNALYMVMILSLTIGFGDFTPTQPAAKVIFIVYALMAVPIVTSFAVQTISGLLSTYSERRARRRFYRRARRMAPSAFDTHSTYVAKAHGVYKELRDKLTSGPDPHDKLLSVMAKKADVYSEGSQQEKPLADAIEDKEEGKDKQEKQDSSTEMDTAGSLSNVSETTDSSRLVKNTSDVRLELVKRLMKLVVQMETEARDLLLESMDETIARTLLMADRNVQVRNVESIRGEDANILSEWRGDAAQRRVEDANKHFTPLVKVRNYRDLFAEILVVGSILQGLEGEEVHQFERWRPVNAEASERDESDGDRQGETADVDLERAGEHKNGLTALGDRLSKFLR